MHNKKGMFMNMEGITVYTKGGEFSFNDEDADTVYEAINNAGFRGAEWTAPFELKDGNKGVFVLSNIEYLVFK